MLEVDTPYDLQRYVGQSLGTSDWLEIDQARIDAFAAVSGDDNWIHVDVERARRELPDGKTIAHGMLTLSLVTFLGAGICRVRQRSRGINYGSNKVRFTAPVQCGARVRLHRTLEAYDSVDGGARLTFGNRIEIEGMSRPAMVAETISVMYAKEAQP
ncbi:MaoC family dehydratase [Achromobacter aloeverae]